MSVNSIQIDMKTILVSWNRQTYCASYSGSILADDDELPAEINVKYFLNAGQKAETLATNYGPRLGKNITAENFR